MGRRFADIELGDELPEAHPDVSLPLVKQFVQAAGMDFPRFTDDAYARSEGLPGAIVPGIMSMGLLSAMIHSWAPGARIHTLDTVFRSPILVGSSPRCVGAVTDTDDDAREVEVDLTIINEDGGTCVMGTATVQLDA